MKQLVIAEKPSVARDIARVLKCNKSINGGLEGEKYIVTWALGHLVTLADPETYSDRYKSWNIEDLPMIPEQFKLEVIKKSSKQFQAVKQLLGRGDVDSVIIATDAGREGELVARWILLKAGNKKPFKRLWISSVTDKAIREGFENLKDGRQYNGLYDAAISRAEADWLVGINATRALTCKYNAQLSCGRVQTPTLAMIAKREEEIKDFTPKSYYGIKAVVKVVGNDTITATWQDAKSNSYSSFDKERIDGLLKLLNSKTTARVTEIKEKEKKEYAPLLYDLTELQRDCNRFYNYSAKQTLNIMQSLYEHHKVLTYPRTDSRYLTEDIVDTFVDRLRAVNFLSYKPHVAKLLRQKYSKKAFYINNAKVSDHHAIIPTEEVPRLANMSQEEKNVYHLVVKRFLAVLMPPYEYIQTSLELSIGNEKFFANGKVVRQLGFKEIYQNQTEELEQDMKELKDQNLPKLIKDMDLDIVQLTMTSGKTTPPARFNEATLLTAMENPVKYMESREKNMVKTLGETGGLGTVATRADIIEKLFNSYLLEKQGKEILITSKGKQLLALVPEDLKKPELTAAWEMKLQRIATGGLKRSQFMQEIKGYSRELIGSIKSSDGTFRHDNLTNQKCPDCGKRMLEVKGKNSTMLVCQDRECGHKETISRTSNARCPQCHKKMELRGKKESQVFTCVCGYKEKLSAFTERRKKEGAGISKKDIYRYMNQQKKQDPVNTAFADAFAKIKL